MSTTTKKVTSFEAAPGIGWDQSGDGLGNHWYADTAAGRRWFSCLTHAEECKESENERAQEIAMHNDNVPAGEEIRA